jgi:PIN domain nuclease of toxin-antitoxin system
LLDTRTFFWAATKPALLPEQVQRIIATDGNDIGVSIASFWEMAIKASLGKWDLGRTLSELEQFAIDEDIEVVSITVPITEVVQNLPRHHDDPFDRLIVATALDRAWVVMSIDGKFDEYAGLQRIW